MTIFDIAFNDDHDIFLSSSDISFSEEDDIVKQRLIIRLQFLLSEWFLDNRAGVPYVQTIFQQGTSIEDIYSIINDEIKNTEGVETINTLDLTPDPNEKHLRIDFKVNENISSTVEVP